MFKHILVATDGSDRADKALSRACTLARRCEARLTALMVVPDYTALDYATKVVGEGMSAEVLRGELMASGRLRLDAVLQRHDLKGLACEHRVEVSDDPYRQILQQAAKDHCDLIVMASHGRGAVQSALLGSQTLQVLSGAQVPVLVVR